MHSYIACAALCPWGPTAKLLSEKGAFVSFLDPFVESWQANGASVSRVAYLRSAVTDADLVIVLQHHRDYDLPALAAGAKRLFDTSGPGLDAENVAHL